MTERGSRRHRALPFADRREPTALLVRFSAAASRSNGRNGLARTAPLTFAGTLSSSGGVDDGSRSKAVRRDRHDVDVPADPSRCRTSRNVRIVPTDASGGKLQATTIARGSDAPSPHVAQPLVHGSSHPPHRLLFLRAEHCSPAVVERAPCTVSPIRMLLPRT